MLAKEALTLKGRGLESVRDRHLKEKGKSWCVWRLKGKRGRSVRGRRLKEVGVTCVVSS